MNLDWEIIWDSWEKTERVLITKVPVRRLQNVTPCGDGKQRSQRQHCWL